MINQCLICDKDLDKNSYCKACNKSFKSYNNLEKISEIYYNLGLEKAKGRNLSGAIESLEQAIFIDKANINARNLLGLIYYEMGETIEALNQWVLSQNYRAEDNLANEYIENTQKNQADLSRINDNIKKYNQALSHAQKGSDDLAIIQLKNVASQFPNFLKAKLLLSLLYYRQKEAEKAAKLLKDVLFIDKGNYLANKYIKEMDIKKETTAKDSTNVSRAMKPTKMAKPPRLNRALEQILLIAFGLVIGVGVLYFLLVPNMINKDKTQVEEMTKKISQLEKEQEDLKSKLIESRNDLRQKEAELESLIEESSSESNTNKSIGHIMEAYNKYFEKDYLEAAKALDQAKSLKITDPKILESITRLEGMVYPDLTLPYYREGVRGYSSNNFETAINNLSLVVKYDPKTSYSPDAYYYLARSYQKSGNKEEAIKYFKILLEKYPNTDKKAYTNNQLRQLEG